MGGAAALAAAAVPPPGLDPARVSWSPDGSRVAVCAYQDGGFHLWTMAPDGGGLHRLTSGPWDDRGVSWSPDGTRIAFSSEPCGDPATGAPYRIWTVDVRSGALTRLTGEPGAEDYDPAWHPDGSRVLFVRAGAKGGRTLAWVPAAGGAATVERTLDDGVAVGPAVGPGGRVAYVRMADSARPGSAASAVAGEVCRVAVSGALGSPQARRAEGTHRKAEGRDSYWTYRRGPTTRRGAVPGAATR